MPIKQRHYEDICAGADKIRANLAGYGFVLNGESEVGIEWNEAGQHGPVLCRGMFDHIIGETGQIIDLKTCDSAHPKRCAAAFARYGYTTQHAAYTRAMAALQAQAPEQMPIDMVYLFVETEPPYAVLPARPSALMREIGEQRWLRAVRVWEECLRTNTWPGYTREVAVLEAPAYLLTDEMMEGVV
jgi:exodeoxyribonuclease VIII